MKKMYVLAIITACLLPLTANADQQLKGGVFSPEQGIICDKKSGFCADSEGISLGYTGEYLGKDAEEKFDKIISSVKEFDTTSFVMSNGVLCDAKKKHCYTNKFDNVIDQAYTRAMFGTPEYSGDAGQRMAEEAMEGIDTSGLENLEQKLKNK
jgi:hypothetical protein